MEQIKEVVSLDYYRTNVGIFLRNMWGGNYNGYAGTPYLNNYRFNGIEFPNVLVGGNFFHLKGLDEITKVEKLKAASKKHVGYILRDDVPVSLERSLKPSYSLEEVAQTWNDDLDKTEYGNIEFSSVRSLYTEAYETVEPYWYEVNATHNVLGTLVVDNYEQPEKMIIRQHSTELYKDRIDPVDLSTIVCYEDFERMLTPVFMLHTRPCSLTSDQVYRIVRAYIKDNINPRAAQVTSDYDFCFTVKRKVWHAPINTKREIKKQNGRSYATPKFKYDTKTHDLVEIFEMTPASKKYNGYTVIAGWQADNLVDMQQQVKYYLDTLMSEINKEVEQCPHCNGVGAIVKEIGTNDRG